MRDDVNDEGLLLLLGVDFMQCNALQCEAVCVDISAAFAMGS